jgi:hypothetical protein
MICFLAVLGVCVFVVMWFVNAVNTRHLEFEDIECMPLAFDRNVLHAASASTMSAEEIALKRYFHDLQMTRQVVSMDQQGKHFFARNWEPSYSCSARLRMGCPGEGGKWICDPHLHLQGDQCVVYSFGSRNEFSFETAVHEFNPACIVHTFDPTVAHPANRPPFVHYHHWGLGTTDASKPGLGSYFTLHDIMRRLGHDHVDVLKVDCEGCELDFWTLDVPDGAVGQLQVEVHWAVNRHDNPERVHAFFNFLSRKGFAIFNKEPNIQYSDGNAVEFALVHAVQHISPS